MKILLLSHFFHPSVGGIEEVSRVLAQEFATAGHVVKVVTSTAREDAMKFPFEIIRRPSWSKLLDLTTWADVVFHNNISLWTAWPLYFIKRPWVVAHHTWILRTDGSIGWRDRLKQFVTRHARNISISEAMRTHLTAPSVVIGNPYRDQLFRRDPAAVRDLELVFLGRLVTDKGLDLLLDGLARMAAQGRKPRLTVIGTGPEWKPLRELCTRLQLDDQVNFAGLRTGTELVELLNRHQIMAVPSRWQEPFGLVALEGMACGCVPVVARCGGLPDAVGDCGVTFPHEDVGEMVRQLEALLGAPDRQEAYRTAAPEHLARHSARAVAAQYLAVMQEAVR